jgi:hypothetical protein
MVFLGLAKAVYAEVSDRIQQNIAQALLATIEALPLPPDITELRTEAPTAVVRGHWSLDRGQPFPAARWLILSRYQGFPFKPACSPRTACSQRRLYFY